jgi:hypothetical protein
MTPLSKLFWLNEERIVIAQITAFNFFLQEKTKNVPTRVVQAVRKTYLGRLRRSHRNRARRSGARGPLQLS